MRTFILVVVLFAFVSLVKPAVAQDDVTIYEYEPYAVKVWYAFDTSVTARPAARETLVRDISWGLERSFEAAWQSQLEAVPESLFWPVVRGIDTLDIDELSEGDFVLAVSIENDNSKALRTIQASLETLEELPTSATNLAALQSKLEQFPRNETLKQIVEKATKSSLVVDEVRSGNQPALLVRRSEVGETKGLRVLPTQLPGQMDSLLRKSDKLFLMVISQVGDGYEVQAREIDCPMRYVGPTMKHTAADWQSLSREAASALARAFAPVARVEDASSSAATLMLKAGGLITDPDNPAAVRVGDVMHPIVRRDNRSGVPTLLEPQSWTYAAITGVEQETLQANVYSYSGGPGLQGRQNARTQRVLLRVRPVVRETEIQVVVLGTGRPQPGCFVYERDLLTDQFNLLGRTDWRGRLAIKVPEEMPRLLPADIKQKKLRATREFDASKAAAEKAAKAPPAADESAEVAAEIAGDAELAEAQARLAEAMDTEQYELPLRYPLKQIYVKSGEFVLGKLAMVPGLQSVEVAELLDDGRRLEIEAFVRGFQVEIIDLIGLRNVLAARIKLYTRDGKIEEAKEVFDRLVSLQNYDEMANRLVEIQRKLLDDANVEIPRYSKGKVDRMFATTRELLQKYLQDNLVNESRARIQAAQSGGEVTGATE
ncbi:MAG: hypothetical protein Aurels2KO_18620 [Aureliella sp.]